MVSGSHLMGKISSILRDQVFVALLLFLLFSFLGAVFSGGLTLNAVTFRTASIRVPLPAFDYTLGGGWGEWIGVLASSATLAAFLSTYLGKKLFITYKVIDYPADHLKVLHSVKGTPKTPNEVAAEFDIPPSVALRIMEDLNSAGLLEKLGNGQRTIYYFPFDKEKAKQRLTT